MNSCLNSCFFLAFIDASESFKYTEYGMNLGVKLVQLPQLIISMLLFIILFFGIGFLLNMLLRSTWIMAVVYPLVVVFIVDKVRFYEYFTSPGTAFPDLINRLLSLQVADILILTSGFVGTIIAGIAIRVLRSKGYQMF